MLHITLLNFLKAFITNPSTQLMILNTITIFHKKTIIFINIIFEKILISYRDYSFNSS